MRKPTSFDMQQNLPSARFQELKHNYNSFNWRKASLNSNLSSNLSATKKRGFDSVPRTEYLNKNDEGPSEINMIHTQSASTQNLLIN